MNFDFSDEQKELAAGMRRILADLCPMSRVRLVLDGPEPFARDLWQELGSLGYLGITIPEEYGGLNLGYLEQCVLAEEFGRALAPLPVSSSLYLAVEALKAAGSGTQKAKWLPKLASGEIIGTVALIEPLSGGPAVSSKLFESKVSGIKAAVPDGDVADLLISLATEEGHENPSLFLVNLASSGVTRSSLSVIDPTRSHADIDLKAVEAERLGAPGEGEGTLDTIVNRAAVLMAFEQIGGADRILEEACDYARQRVAFGRPIGSFQAIKHMLADMYVSATLGRSNAYYGAWALSTNAVELPLAAAIARVSATQAFQHCARNAIQVHGGNGFTWEYDCHLYYRRAVHLGLTLGSAATWEHRLVHRLAAHGQPA